MKPRPTHPRPCTACATGERCNFRRAQNGGFGGAICTFFVGHAASRATLAPAVKAKGRVRTAKLVRVERSGRRARLVLRGARVSEKVGVWVAFGSPWGRVGPTPLPEVLGGPTVDSAAKLASLNRAGRSRPLKWPPAVPQSCCIHFMASRDEGIDVADELGNDGAGGFLEFGLEAAQVMTDASCARKAFSCPSPHDCAPRRPSRWRS